MKFSKVHLKNFRFCEVWAWGRVQHSIRIVSEKNGPEFPPTLDPRVERH